ncbi:GNAT family N-acetyltransferase [Mucilaginibacter auburnensis]|uniref:RimJ/RimL family protein N-acetyltransferase n=1 Tax=Mucilaginibacter auburnensis TaxID=1457233 RepID=A0A2H9VSD1_9SPHI|nr:GNAT family protein [Mucilaginibacter auburnensis]PJJ83702.1 RimJ/RimL family protein N-acetyltransferase [Mucilaginibacter auburnensis]
MVLTGSNFILRRWEVGDAPSLRKNGNDERVSSMLLDRFPAPYTLEDAEAFINLKIPEEPVTNFALEIEGEVAGVIGVDMRADIYRKTPLLGYWISPTFSGKGIMTEAVKLIADYAFSNLDVICIQANTLGNNIASMRVLEKAGFKKQGILTASVIKNGLILDECIYTLHPPKTKSR